ncbi:MAG: 3-deoxy-D-manno-octulosonic acid transferase, partial [Hyphomicrobiales bacterium]|nr:3-deoxy-D-manno-octulosonic acid transferase [Hyphomicrobiales bacterium]
LEAARLGAAVLPGPDVANFRDAYAALDGAGAARQIADAAGLARAALDLLGDPGAARAMARRGAEALARDAGALERTLDLLAPLLPSGAVPR